MASPAPAAEIPGAASSVAAGLASEVDLADWQRFVDGRPEAGCMHHAGWFLVLRDAFKVVPRYLIARDEEGRIRGVLPAYLSRSRIAGRHISSLEGGVLADDGEAARALLARARALRDESGAHYLQLRGGATGDGGCGHELRTVQTVIATDRPPERIWAGIKKKTRWAIRQMEKQPVGIERADGAAGLEAFYMAYAAHMRDLGTPVVGLAAFRAVYANLTAARLRLYLVRYGGRTIGGMLCILNGDRWTDHFAAVRVAPETQYANYLLYWHVLRDAAQSGAKSLNLGRSTPDSGVHLFKRKWGGVDVEVPYYFEIAPGAQPRNMGLQRMKENRSLSQRLWTRLPLPLANRLGPLLRQQLPFV